MPTINDPFTFGLRLGVGYACCKQLIKDNKSDVNTQVQEIVAEWYNRPPHPTWNKVVEALHKHGLVNDAVDLASKVGVKSLVPQEDDDNYYH